MVHVLYQWIHTHLAEEISKNMKGLCNQGLHFVYVKCRIVPDRRALYATKMINVITEFGRITPFWYFISRVGVSSIESWVFYATRLTGRQVSLQPLCKNFEASLCHCCGSSVCVLVCVCLQCYFGWHCCGSNVSALILWCSILDIFPF